MVFHPRFKTFRRRLEEEPDLMHPWEGNGFRFVNLSHIRPEDILSGQGSFLFGGRWNAPESFRAMYASTDKTVAVRESDAIARYYGFAADELRPRLLVAVHIRLEKMLDFTASATREAMRISLRTMKTDDWRLAQKEGHESVTQALGRAAFVVGAEGILVPSARVKGGVNVVIFLDNLGDASEMGIWNEAELRKLR